MALIAKFEEGVLKQQRKASGKHLWKVDIWYRWEDGTASEDSVRPSKCYWNDILPLILNVVNETLNEEEGKNAISFGFRISI